MSSQKEERAAVAKEESPRPLGGPTVDAWNDPASDDRNAAARAAYLSMVHEAFVGSDSSSTASGVDDGESVIASSALPAGVRRGLDERSSVIPLSARSAVPASTDAPLRKGNALNEASERASTASPIDGASVRASVRGGSRGVSRSEGASRLRFFTEAEREAIDGREVGER